MPQFKTLIPPIVVDVPEIRYLRDAMKRPADDKEAAKDLRKRLGQHHGPLSSRLVAEVIPISLAIAWEVCTEAWSKYPADATTMHETAFSGLILRLRRTNAAVCIEEWAQPGLDA